jgi:hypothetical protein
MRTDLNLTRLAALLGVTAILAAGFACSQQHDDPAQAENVVLVNSITTAGTSVSTATDTTATVVYTLNPRNPNPDQSATTFWHDITLTSYSVAFEPAVVAPISGPISTGFCPAGGTCSADIILVPNGSKPGAGTTVVAHIAFEGRDANDNPVNFTADAAVTFIP